MLALFAAVLVSSLLGSAHCAGMCGAFVALAVGGPDGQGRLASRAALNAAYNGGRLVTYLALGVVAGMLGAALDLGGSLVGVQRAAAAGAGVLMIGVGVVALARHFGARVLRVPVPRLLASAARAGHQRAFALPPLMRVGAIGLMTTLLPCGWLYAFVVIAAGTASPVWGPLAMGAFWLGTLPVMGALGFGIQGVLGPLRSRLPLITSLVLVSAGAWTLMGRAMMPSLNGVASSAPAGISGSIERASHVEDACPLCTGGGRE